MQDMISISSMLSRLQNISGYDIRLISVSPSYVKLDQRVSLHPSCTVEKLVQAKFPWLKLDDGDLTIGFGVCTNNEPRSMKWNSARVILNREIHSLWPKTPLSAHEEYLVVCCMFSREQYNRQKHRVDVALEEMNRQKARLDAVLEDMGKWIPPS